MKLKDLKEKLKNKVQESKTKQFVEEHKNDITKYVIIFGGTFMCYMLCKKSFNTGYNVGFNHGATTASILSDVDKETVSNMIKDEATITQITLKPKV